MAFGHAAGLPWWGAVLVAMGCALLGALVNNLISGDFGIAFGGAYLVGCVAAVCMVRRSNLFAPMVQPPLLVAVTVPVVALLVGSSGGNSGKAKLLSVGTSLINQFPVMAIATVITIGVGVARIYLQKRPAPKAGRAASNAGSTPAPGSRKPAASGRRTGKPQSGSAATAARTATAAGSQQPRSQSQPRGDQQARPEPARGQTAGDQGGTERRAAKPRTPAGEGQQPNRTPRRDDAAGAAPRRGEQPARGNQRDRGHQPAPGQQPPQGHQPPPGQQPPQGQRPARGRPAGGQQPSRGGPGAPDQQETRANPVQREQAQPAPGAEQPPDRRGGSAGRREPPRRTGRPTDDRGVDAPWKRAFGRGDQPKERDEPGSARDRARQIRENTERNVQRRTDSTRRQPRRRPED